MLSLVALSALALVAAQRPENTSICDYYTGALLNDSTPANQYTVVTLLVNTAVIGNYTQPNMNAVPGILAPGTFNGQNVSLAPYFTGALRSTNNNGTAVAVNFLDGGGAAPLQMNMAANNESSAQYALLTHLYQYFGLLLGCSGAGQEGFPSYAGDPNMARVHRFMVLDENEMGYFITQVGLSAASFGVAEADVMAVGMALNSLFNIRCSPPENVGNLGNYTQSMCQAPSCPYGSAGDSSCSAYPAPVPEPEMVGPMPMPPSGSMAPPAPSMSMSMAGPPMPMPPNPSSVQASASAAASSMIARFREVKRAKYGAARA